MSREIKFRAWNTARECWTSRVGLKGGYGNPLYLEGELENVGGYQTSQIIIEQYTGLKDKNGKEIYEGDIVKYLKANYEVYFDKMQGWRGLRRGSHSTIPIGETVYEMTINCVDRPEVIGNIHENPELLGGEE